MFHLAAHPETEALVLSGDSSNHSHRTDAERFTKLNGLLFNLLCQLTSGSQDHSIWTLIRVLNPVRTAKGSKYEFLKRGKKNKRKKNKTSKTKNPQIKNVMGFY